MRVFSFPRAAGGLRIRVQPPPDQNSQMQNCERPQIKLRGQCNDQRELLRIHDGYCSFDDRLLRFDENGSGERAFEVWDHSKWRPAKRNAWLICSDYEDGGDVERVLHFTFLDIEDSWSLLRGGQCPGWAESS